MKVLDLNYGYMLSHVQLFVSLTVIDETDKVWFKQSAK
jgi:hypothetical protein